MYEVNSLANIVMLCESAAELVKKDQPALRELIGMMKKQANMGIDYFKRKENEPSLMWHDILRQHNGY